MRKFRMMILVALAGAVWKKWLQPRLPAAKTQLAQTRDRVEPALRKLTGKARHASKNAVESVRDLSLAAAETAEAVRDVTLSAAETADSVASTIAEPGADDATHAHTDRRASSSH
jgi:hypothetical protein